MISNVISFKKGSNKIREITDEAEKVAVYNGLSGKDVLHLRLLTEEVCCMIDVLVQSFEGDFWINSKKGKYELYVSLNADSMNLELKEELVRASTAGKNASAKGMIGRIRNVVENFAMVNDGNTLNIYDHDVDSADMNYSSAWLFSQYKSDIQNAPESVVWDELEKSILAKLADEVIVGVRGKKIEIVVKKEFAAVGR